MDAPAQTTGYMIAGYAVIFSALVIYLASLVLRWRRLRQDEAMLKEIEERTLIANEASKRISKEVNG